MMLVIDRRFGGVKDTNNFIGVGRGWPHIYMSLIRSLNERCPRAQVLNNKTIKEKIQWKFDFGYKIGTRIRYIYIYIYIFNFRCTQNIV